MSVFRSIPASILAASLLLAVVPSAQADAAVDPPVCREEILGPDVMLGVCVDPTGECALLTYGYYSQTCHAPGAGVVPRAHCERVFYGPDIDQGLCYDMGGQYVDGMECIVWWYSVYSTGQDECYVPAPPLAATATAAPPRAFCQQVLVGPDIDQGLCYDLDGQYMDGMNCVVWWYAKYGTGQDRCYVPYPPGAVAASHAQPIVCVGDEGPELPGVCYDPDDYDGCDVYAGLGGGNQVCLVPSQNTCPSSTPEWPGVCWTPRQECQLWIGLGRVYCIYPVSASTTDASADATGATTCVGRDGQAEAAVCYAPNDGDGCDAYVAFHHNNYVCVVPDLAVATATSTGAAPPRAFCQQVLVGPDIDQGVCYDLDGQYVAGINCIVWWYSTYSTGQDRCYVPYPPGAVAANAASTASTDCVGYGGQSFTGVCYDPADGDGCDAYVAFHHNNQVCVVPEPRSSVAASTAAPPRASCHQVLVGPDIDQGLCYDLDGEQVNGRECLVWWYAKYGTGTTTCYVPQPVTSGIDETCYHLPDGGEVRSVCHDTTRDTCQVWAEGTGPDRCLT